MKQKAGFISQTSQHNTTNEKKERNEKKKKRDDFLLSDKDWGTFSQVGAQKQSFFLTHYLL